MRRALIVLLALACCTGCVGVFSLSEETKVDQRVSLQNTRGYISWIVTPDHDKDPSYTKRQVEGLWGRPDDIETANKFERWRYDRELGWSGLVITAVIVPIPLLVPVGYRSPRSSSRENGSKRWRNNSQM
jgi:hypothetical protein